MTVCPRYWWSHAATMLNNPTPKTNDPRQPSMSQGLFGAGMTNWVIAINTSIGSRSAVPPMNSSRGYAFGCSSWKRISESLEKKLAAFFGSLRLKTGLIGDACFNNINLITSSVSGSERFYMSLSFLILAIIAFLVRP